SRGAGSRSCDAIDRMDFPQGAHRCVAAPVLAVDFVAASPATPVLSIEERCAAHARPKRSRDDAAATNPPVADQRVERRPGPRVAEAVFRGGDLDHDAGVGGTVGPLRELDVPVAVVFVLVDPAYPRADAVHLALALRASSAPVSRPEVGRRPG